MTTATAETQVRALTPNSPVLLRPPSISSAPLTLVAADLIPVPMILPFPEGHTNGATQHMTFCLWYLPLSMMLPFF